MTGKEKFKLFRRNPVADWRNNAVEKKPMALWELEETKECAGIAQRGGILMLIDTACSVALYCQHCGRIQLQDVPLFSGKKYFEMQCDNCGHTMGEIVMRPRTGLTLRTICGVCEGENRHQLSWRQLRKLRFEKLYCAHDHFELGYIGQWQDIAEFLDFNAAEYDSLHPGDGDEFLERRQTLLEALNRVHDLAAQGELSCLCGSKDIAAAIMGESIVLECQTCGACCVLPARTAEDLQQLRPGMAADFIWKQPSRLDVREK